jgi:uncharacterized protein YgiB involved in biofilm formation
MAGSGLTLAACGDDAPRSQWIDPPAATATVDPDRGQAFTTLEECKAAADFAPADCEQAFAAAQKENEANAPRFAEQQTCEEQFGAGNCVPRQAAGGGGSFFVPLLAGFVMGQVLDDIGDRRYRGRPYYRDRYGYGYVPGYGRLSRDYISGRPRVSGGVLAPPRAQAPARTQSRSAVISRGGFGGGGGRSYGG